MLRTRRVGATPAHRCAALRASPAMARGADGEPSEGLITKSISVCSGMAWVVLAGTSRTPPWFGCAARAFADGGPESRGVMSKTPLRLAHAQTQQRSTKRPCVHDPVSMEAWSGKA